MAQRRQELQHELRYLEERGRYENVDVQLRQVRRAIDDVPFDSFIARVNASRQSGSGVGDLASAAVNRLKNVAQRMRLSELVLKTAATYFERVGATGQSLGMPEPALMIVCFALAHKYLTETSYGASSIGRMIGVNAPTLTRWERTVLEKLDYTLSVGDVGPPKTPEAA